MIDELRAAFGLAAQQSEHEQGAIAARIKMMTEADQQWDQLPSDPDSMSMLEEMAEQAHQEYIRGEINDYTLGDFTDKPVC